MSYRKSKFLEIVLGQTGKVLEVDVVISERLRVLTEAKSFEPLRDVVRHRASLRQAGFAETVQELLPALAEHRTESRRP